MPKMQGHVLIVEDGPELCYVETANNGQEGLKQLETFPAEIILTDLMMPKMDGFALIDQVRTQNPLLPVVIFSAYDSRDQILQALQYGAYDFVPKPFDKHLRFNEKF